jgi:DNA polymerase-4
LYQTQHCCAYPRWLARQRFLQTWISRGGSQAGNIDIEQPAKLLHLMQYSSFCANICPMSGASRFRPTEGAVSRVRPTEGAVSRVRPTEGAEAAILHADLDAFYASVEQRDDQRLRSRPVIVGMGVVLAASYEAKRFGVRTAMGGRQAQLLCPQAVTVPPRFHAYVEASRAVFDIFYDTTPVVEGLSIDEAFLDVRGLRRIAGPPAQVAARLRRRVLAEVGLPITVGVARTKFLAKVASGVAKPDGLLVVPPDEELEFLRPLPVERLWGVGKVTAQKLRERGIRTVRQVADVGEPALVSLLGKGVGHHLHALAHNQDPRPVQVGRRRASIGSQQALGRGRRSPEEIDAIASGLVDRVTRRLRRAGRTGRTVVLRMRFDDFTRASRSHTLARPTSHTPTILRALRTLLAQATPLIEGRGLTLVGVAVMNLDDDGALQPELPFDQDSGTELDAALDRIRDRFGSAAVTRGTLVGRDPGITLPMLPD